MRQKRKKTWKFWTSLALGVALVGGGASYLFLNQSSSKEAQAETILVQKATEGSLASSTLLSATVAADSEQYVYFDATKGDLESVLVNVGDQVASGQALVQYKSIDAQTAYDAAVRNINKIDRQITELKTNGVISSVQTTDGSDDTSATYNAQRSYNAQMSDLQDSRATAVDEMNKALAQLNATTVLSNIEGTVVEVNRDVSKSATSTAQTLVHIVGNGNLQVKGDLSEYNLANISVGQEVKISSKVYPDQTWTGKINFISDYPKEEQASAANNQQSGAKYPFKAEITSDIGALKQGFSVNVEVNSPNQSILVPLESVVTEGDKNYVWTIDDQGMAKKVEVTLGNADAKSQEITSGLSKNTRLITNPSTTLKDGKEVTDYENLD
ncbi:efflux RND transporter periplasmic adaptor subunit [Streptococcus sp. zg-JUN1979]|uniref:efflux RND transporter periplasmic adaptor subunit n=1 Tax=Streptococcus sp. zg-JUN1979 TaxID=3391450 RepID=UPI0039A4497E